MKVKAQEEEKRKKICVLFLSVSVNEKRKKNIMKKTSCASDVKKAWNMKEKYDGMKFHSNKRHTAWINI